MGALTVNECVSCPQLARAEKQACPRRRRILGQNHGVHRDKLFALEPINHEAIGLRVIELRELQQTDD
jgi:hypothetical protein